MAISPELQKLIDQQTSFISGMQPNRIESKPVVFSNAFEPTLTDMLRTGRPVDTTGIGRAAEMDATRFFRDMQNQINASAAAGGGVGSSAQTASLAQALGDVSSRLGSEVFRAGVSANENAANRSLSALDPAVAHAGLLLQGRGQDLADAQFGLSGKTAQAGAGQDLIDALLRGLPLNGLMGQAVGPQYGNTNVRGNEMIPAGNRMITVGTGSTGGFNPFAALSHGTGLAPFLSGLGTPEMNATFNRQLEGNAANRLATNAGIVGPAGAASMANAGTAGFGNLLSGMTANAGNLATQSQQQNFLNDLARRFGPAFAMGGGR